MAYDPSIDPKDYLPQSVSKHHHKTKLDESVFKATKSIVAPAKPKHERTILAETWTTNSAYHVYAELFKRPLGGKEIVLFKTLIIVHKLLRDGHPQCIEDLFHYKEMLESLHASTQGTSATPWSAMNGSYLRLLLDKLEFHKNHTDVGGEISLQKYKEKHRKFNSKNTLSLVSNLLNLQKTLLSFQASVLQQTGLNECKLAALLPVILESYSIYTMTEYFLKKLVEYDIDKDTVDKLLEQFQLQYPIVQKFYFNCNNIPYINRIISVPSLPTTAPTFKATASLPKTSSATSSDKSSSKKRNSRRSEESSDTLFPGVQSFDIINSSAGRPSNLLSSGGGYSHLLGSGGGYSNILGSGGGYSNILGSGGGYSNILGSGSGFSSTSPFPQIGFGSGQVQNPFAVQNVSQPGFVSGQYSQQQQQQQQGGFNQSPFSVSSPFNTPFAPSPQAQPQPQPQPQPSIPQIILPDAGVQVHQVRESETREALLDRIRELEAKIQSLENILRDKKLENERLKKLLSESGGSVANERAILEEKFQEQQRQFMAVNGALKDNLEKMAVKYEADKKNLLSGQIDFSKESVDQHLLRFDDPYFLGNKVATADDILKSTESLRNLYEQLLKSLTNEGNTVVKSRQLADATIKFLDETKGAMIKIEAADSKLQIGEGSRTVASEVSKLLGYAKQLAPQGKPDERQNQFLQSEKNRFMQRLLELEKSINSSQKPVETDTSDLEGLAERELINAAKTIQEAAAALMAENARRQIKVRPGEMDLEGSIMDAAMGIATATQELVTAAAYAQQERVKHGLGKRKDGEPYFRDPRWTEGLISAGKSVAEATRELVKFANKAAQGTIDDAALIAASKVVSASTATLVQATHSKSTPGSKSAAGVDAASVEVSKASKILVDTAKRFQEHEETQSKARLTGNADLFDQQAIVSRLESQLEEARRQLGEKRRERYKAATTGSGSPRNRPLPTQHQQQQPQYFPNASIDTSSVINLFKETTEGDVRMPSYQAKLEATLARGLQQQPQSQPQQQFNPFL